MRDATLNFLTLAAPELDSCIRHQGPVIGFKTGYMFLTGALKMAALVDGNTALELRPIIEACRKAKHFKPVFDALGKS